MRWHALGAGLIWFIGVLPCAVGQEKAATGLPTAREPVDLVAGFGSEPVTSLYYKPGKFPEGVKAAIAMGNKAVPALAEGLEDENANVRFTCVVALDHIKLDSDSKDLVGPLMVKALGDESAWVRTEAAWGLGRMSWKKATCALIDALDDDERSVVQEALIALDKMHWGVLPGVTSSLDISPERVKSLTSDWKAYAEAKKAKRKAVPPRILPEGVAVEAKEVEGGQGGIELMISLPAPVTVRIVGAGGETMAVGEARTHDEIIEDFEKETGIRPRELGEDREPKGGEEEGRSQAEEVF